MKYTRYDFYALGDAIAYGVRPTVTLEEGEPTWEVYVKLANSTRIVAASGGTRKQAKKALRKILDNIQVDKALIATLDDTMVDARRVMRVYADTQVNAHVALIEDSTGEAYRVFEGDKQECRAAVMGIAQAIASLHSADENSAPFDWEDEDDDGLEREAT